MPVINLSSIKVLIILFAGFSVGIITVFYLRVSWFIIIFFLLIWLMFWFKARLKPVWQGVILLLLFFSLGLMYTKVHLIKASDNIVRFYSYFKGKEVWAEGIVVSFPENKISYRTEKTSFIFKVDQIWIEHPTEKTKIWEFQGSGFVVANIFQPVKAGVNDHLRLKGKFHYPFTAPDDKSPRTYRDYLSNRNVHLVLSVKRSNPVTVIRPAKGLDINTRAYNVRLRLKNLLHAHLSPGEAGLMSALLLGDRSGLPMHITETFKRTGTIHVLAISGWNLSVVAGLILFILRIFPPWGESHQWQKLRLIFVIAILWFYTLMAGAGVSVVRSFIMVSVFLVAFILERSHDLMNSLALAGLAILMYNPFLLFDVGFQLSFACVLSLIVFFPFIYKTLQKLFQVKENASFHKDLSGLPDAWLYFMQDSLLMSVAASLAVWIGVEGLLAFYFGNISPIVIVANLVVLPLITLVTALGIGFLIFGFLWEPLAFCFAICMKVTINFIVWIVVTLSKCPWAYFQINPISLTSVILYYFILIFIYWFLIKRYNSKLVL